VNSGDRGEAREEAMQSTMQPQASSDITRVMLFVLVIGLLLVGSLWTLLPFLNGLTWATTIAIATWPVLLRVQAMAGGRRWAAVAIMTVVILLVFIIPFAVAISSLIDAANRSPAVIDDFLAHGLTPPPDWIVTIPLVGAKLSDKWAAIAAAGPEGLRAFVEPYGRDAAAWALAATGGFGRFVIHILFTILLVAILYGQGEIAARGVLAFMRRLGGETGERTMILASQAIRSVALGVVVTALIQSVLAGLGLYFCGIPHPGLLTALVFVFGVAQLGPVPVLLPAIAWLFWSGSTGAGTALLIWGLPVATLDNVIRPILIRRGVQLPLLLIIAGVIGGLISFGVVGLFVGPVLLAATYTLAKDWVARDPSGVATTSTSTPTPTRVAS
jgi:predicted PurR-regulated permease PerM